MTLSRATVKDASVWIAPESGIPADALSIASSPGPCAVDTVDQPPKPSLRSDNGIPRGFLEPLLL